MSCYGWRSAGRQPDDAGRGVTSRASAPGTFRQRQRRREVSMKKLFNRFVRDEEGQDLIEYALLASLIAVAGIVGASLIGPRIAQIWTDVVDAFAPGG